MPARNRFLIAFALAACFGATAAAAQDVYLTNFQYGGTNGEILRFSAATGAFVDRLATTLNSPLQTPARLLIGPDGRLYVQDDAGILRFDLHTGASLGRFVASDTLGAIAFGTDGNLYALEYNGGPGVRRFDGTTGAPLGFLIPQGTGNLGNPSHLVFGPDGDLYVADPFG